MATAHEAFKAHLTPAAVRSEDSTKEKGKVKTY